MWIVSRNCDFCNLVCQESWNILVQCWRVMGKDGGGIGQEGLGLGVEVYKGSKWVMQQGGGFIIIDVVLSNRQSSL